MTKRQDAFVWCRRQRERTKYWQKHAPLHTQTHLVHRSHEWWTTWRPVPQTIFAFPVYPWCPVSRCTRVWKIADLCKAEKQDSTKILHPTSKESTNTKLIWKMNTWIHMNLRRTPQKDRKKSLGYICLGGLRVFVSSYFVLYRNRTCGHVLHINTRGQPSCCCWAYLSCRSSYVVIRNAEMWSWFLHYQHNPKYMPDCQVVALSVTELV